MSDRPCPPRLPSEHPRIDRPQPQRLPSERPRLDRPRGASARRLASLLVAGVAIALAAGSSLAADPSPSASVEPGSRPPIGPMQGAMYDLPPIEAPPMLTPTELADGHALGAQDAPVTVEVWEDFQCPFCQEFTFTVKPQIIEEYVVPGKVRLVYRDMAFLGEESRWAAVAASLAADQGEFWPYHDYLFGNLLGEHVGSFSFERLLTIAEIVGLDMESFVAGLQMEAARARFAERQGLLQEDGQRYGISGTPTVVVAGAVVTRDTEQGPRAVRDWDSVRAAIEAALAASEDGASPGAEGSNAPGSTAGPEAGTRVEAVASPAASTGTDG